MSVLPNTCAWEKIQISKESEEEGKQKRVNMERKTVGTNKISPNGLTSSSSLKYERGYYSVKQWMNYPTNLTYTYNPSTTPWKRVSKIILSNLRIGIMINLFQFKYINFNYNIF